MPFHSDEPHYVLRMAEANRLFKFAMRRSPEAYYEALSRPDITYLSRGAGEFTDAEFTQEFDEESYAIDLFESGIQDIIPPFVYIADQFNITKEQSLALMSDPRTIATYGMLASMSQAGLRRVNHETEEHFTLSDDKAALVLKRPVRSSPDYGCEAVDARTGTPNMSPIFRKFVPWAGQLAAHAYFKYGE